MQCRDLFQKRVNGMPKVSGINSLQVLVANITYIYSIVLFLFTKEVVQCGVILVITEWTVYSLCMPFVAAKAANEESVSLIPKHRQGRQAATNRAISLLPRQPVVQIGCQLFGTQ
jgi:hypothetical protein